MTTQPTDPEVIKALARIEAKLDTAIGRVDDHEGRLRALEKWRYDLPVGLGALGALVVEVINRLQGG